MEQAFARWEALFDLTRLCRSALRSSHLCSLVCSTPVHINRFGIVVQRLPIAPVNLADRLRQAYQTEPDEAARQLAALVEETYDLIEQHVPQVDVDHLRRIFRYRRPLWEQPPPVNRAKE